VPPYVDCVVNEATGLLVDNSVEAWIGALERLIEDQPLREAIKRRAFSDVSERYNQQSSVSQLKTILCAIADSAGEAGKFDDVAA
jgi:glycosyltransferase involved in cell wall biosynthesis